MTADRFVGEQQRQTERVAAMIEARDEHAEQVVATAASFPVYEVPAEVLDRFPGFDPANPETWPEPDRCTEGRPWGHDAYGSTGRDLARRWENYLRRPALLRSCRNRWRDAETHLCGTHLRPYREAVERARRRVRVNERTLQHLDLAKRLGAYGIVADGQASGVLLQADAVEGLLRLLDRVSDPA